MSRTFHHGKHGKRWVYNISYACWPTPSWYVCMFMNRPQRHRDREMITAIIQGKIDMEEAAFSLGNRKPHVYFW